jgi:hypothetical protein
MLRHISLVIALAACVALPITASAAPAHGKRHVTHHLKGYGFLPGYRPPADRYRYPEYGYQERSWWWYGGPRFYHGRWNGGGFGPCWKPTPIGPVWICG